MDELQQLIADGCQVTFAGLENGRTEVRASKPGQKIVPTAWSVRISASTPALALEALWAAYQQGMTQEASNGR